MPAKLLFEYVKKNIEELGYFLINDNESDLVYKKDGLFVNIVDNYGYKYFSRYADIKNHPPYITHKSNPYSLENISLWLLLNNKDFELCEDNIYINKEKKLKCYCYICKHNFFSSWDNILQNRGCGVCAGKQVVYETSLICLNPNISREWIKSEHNLSPYNVSLHSNENVYWCCEVCKYKWWTKVNDRSNGNGCPSCSGLVVSDNNRLSIRFPNISSEWHPTLNGDLNPSDVSYSVNIKCWWLCKTCDHKWFTSINGRTNMNSGCPKCASGQSESKIAHSLKEYILENYNAETEYRIFKNPKTGRFLPYDIYIYDNVFIEIRGLQHYKINSWHKRLAKRNNRTIEDEFKYRQHLDKIKKEFAEENGIYIEIDLRKIKTIEETINYIKNILK